MSATRPCPNCGAEWPDEIRYCGECGGRMPDATVVASPYKVQIEVASPPALGPSAPAPGPAPVTLAPPSSSPAPAPPPPAPPPRALAPTAPPPAQPSPVPRDVALAASKLMSSDELEAALFRSAQEKAAAQSSAAPPAPAPTPPSPPAPAAAPPAPAPAASSSSAPVPVASALLVPPDPQTIVDDTRIDLDVIGEAWVLVRQRLGVHAVGTVVVGLAACALVATVLGALVLGPLLAGFAIVALRAASGRRVVFNDFFNGIYAPVPLTITGLIVGAGVVVGSALLVVPGVYLGMASSYAFFLVVDRNVSPWQAVQQSIQAFNAQLGAHIVLFLVLGLLNFVASLACGVGLIVSLPLSAVAVGVCYGRIFGFQGGVDRLG